MDGSNDIACALHASARRKSVYSSGRPPGPASLEQLPPAALHLKADVAKPEIAAKIAANRTMARRIGINATPGLIIDDNLQAGTPNLEGLKKAVAEARAQKVASAR